MWNELSNYEKKSVITDAIILVLLSGLVCLAIGIWWLMN